MIQEHETEFEEDSEFEKWYGHKFDSGEEMKTYPIAKEAWQISKKINNRHIRNIINVIKEQYRSGHDMGVGYALGLIEQELGLNTKKSTKTLITGPNLTME